MTGRVLLCLFVMSVGGASSGWADELERAARAAVVANRLRDAAALYAQLSEREPDNADYLVWIGRLRSWLQEYQAALDAYERALTRAPRNVEALVGKVSVLLWTHKFSHAYDGLLQAEQIAPNSADVQLAFARYHHYQHQERAAHARMRHALALEPANAEALQLQSQILLPRPLEVSIGYGQDGYSFAPGDNLGFLTVGYTVARGRLAFQYERWDKFGEAVDRAGVSASGRVSDRVWLRGGAMFAPGARVLARQEYSAGFSRSWASGVVVTADYRRAELLDVHVHVASPGIEYYFADRPVWLQAVVSESWTQFAAPINTSVAAPAVLLRYNQQIARPLVVHVGYAAGRESFAALSIDRVGSFRANTYNGGVDIHVSPACSVALAYTHQRRSGGARQQTVGISVSLRE